MTGVVAVGVCTDEFPPRKAVRGLAGGGVREARCRDGRKAAPYLSPAGGWGDTAPADLMTDTLHSTQAATDTVRAVALRHHQPVTASVPGPEAESWGAGGGVSALQKA